MRTSDEIHWFGPDGEALASAAGAAACEVVEYLDGVPVRRTYADLDGDAVASVEPPVEVYENEDWLKPSTWDLFYDAELVERRAQLFALFGFDELDVDDQRAAVMHLMELPSWEAAPAQLQGEVYEWLRLTDPVRTSPQRLVDQEVGDPAETKALKADAARERARDEAEHRILRWEEAIADLLTAFYDRQRGVVVARLRGTKARQGTRHWNPAPPATESKALDVGAVIQPERWAAGIAADAEEVVLRVWRQASDTAAGDLGLSAAVALDSPIVRAAVAERVRRIMSSTETRARQVADVILNLDADGAALDEIIDAVQGTYDQRQIWAATTARTETTGLVNLSSLTTAQAVGLKTKEWLSSRDDKVRHTHSRAGGGDGQTVPIGLPFVVGGFPLLYPGDPAGPPQETINCRCSLLFGGGVDGQDTAAAFRPQADDDPAARAVAWQRTLLHLNLPDAEETPFLDALGELFARPTIDRSEAWVDAFEAVLDLVQRHAILVASGAPDLASELRATLTTALDELGVPEPEAQRILLALAAREAAAG